MLFPAFRLQDRIQKMTLGEKGWVEVAKRVAKAKYIQEYMRVHGGELPPESFVKKLFRCFRDRPEVAMAMAAAELEEAGR